MNKTLKLSLAALLLAGAAQAQELRGWNTHVPDYPVSIAFDRFVEMVEERTEGRV